MQTKKDLYIRIESPVGYTLISDWFKPALNVVIMVKDAKTFCYHLLLFGEVLPTSDQFYLIMFDNLYVKHNISNLGDENSLKY